MTGTWRHGLEAEAGSIAGVSDLGQGFFFFFFIYKVKKLDYQDIQIFPSYKLSTMPLKNLRASMRNKKPILFQEEHLYVCLHSAVFFMYDKF